MVTFIWKAQNPSLSCFLHGSVRAAKAIRVLPWGGFSRGSHCRRHGCAKPRSSNEAERFVVIQTSCDPVPDWTRCSQYRCSPQGCLPGWNSSSKTQSGAVCTPIHFGRVLSLSMPWRLLTPSARGCSDSLFGVIETVRALIGFHYMFPAEFRQTHRDGERAEFS